MKNFDNIKELVKTIKKGSFVCVDYRSFPKPLAAHKTDIIEKRSSGVYRLGITYANLKANAEKVTGGLPWGEWEDGEFNYIVKKEQKDGSVKEYLRVYTTETHKTITKYFLNGEEVAKQWLIDNGYMGQRKPSSEPTLCFVVPLENILKVSEYEFNE